MIENDDRVMNKSSKESTQGEVLSRCTMTQYDMRRNDWATYLFSKRFSMIGLSEKLLHQYVEYIANRRMRMIGLEQKYEHSSSQNPLPWTIHWFKGDHFKMHHKKQRLNLMLLVV